MANVATYIAGFNVGTDVSFAITDQYGDVFDDTMMGHLTMFSSRSEDNVVKVTPISQGGKPIYQCMWNGHRGSMRFVRMSAAMTQIFVGLQNAYHDAGIISQMTILAQVRNRDGTIDSYTYSGLQLINPTYGEFTGNREVDMQCEFRASDLQLNTSSLTLISALSNAAG